MLTVDNNPQRLWRNKPGCFVKIMELLVFLVTLMHKEYKIIFSGQVLKYTLKNFLIKNLEYGIHSVSQ